MNTQEILECKINIPFIFLKETHQKLVFDQ